MLSQHLEFVRVVKKHFNEPLVMAEDDEMRFKLMDAVKSTLCALETIVTLPENQECNLKLRIKPENLKIPVIFHSLRGYDSHFIMQQIGKIANAYAYKDKPLTINAIPTNMEKYMAFMLGNHLTLSIVSNL